MDAMQRQIGAGLSAGGAKALGYTASTTLFAGAGGVLGAIAGVLVGGMVDESSGPVRSAAVGGAVGALLGGVFGAVLTYETAQGVSSAAAAVGA